MKFLTLFKRKRLPSKPNYSIGVFRPYLTRIKCKCGYTVFIPTRLATLWHLGIHPFQCRNCKEIIINNHAQPVKRYMEAV